MRSLSCPDLNDSRTVSNSVLTFPAFTSHKSNQDPLGVADPASDISRSGLRKLTSVRAAISAVRSIRPDYDTPCGEQSTLDGRHPALVKMNNSGALYWEQFTQPPPHSDLCDEGPLPTVKCSGKALKREYSKRINRASGTGGIA